MRTNGRSLRWTLLILVTLTVPVTSVLSAQQAPDDSVLVRRERAQWEALKTRDTTAFARLLGPNLVDVDVTGVKQPTAATAARYVLGCQTATYGLSDIHVAHDGSTAVVTSKVTLDQTCWGQRAPSPLYVLTVYTRHSNDWEMIAHSETPAARY
jgi:ketosteroid isomerase-like protein